MVKQQHLSNNLKNRHILMIALGSAIGTGLFLGSGESIKLAGPSILLSYLIGGIMMYLVIRALGEMIIHEPNSGSFSFYAYKYIGSYAGFIYGWNYWFNYIIVCMLELTATTIFLDYWFPSLSHWLVALILLIIFTIINLLSVKFFGEFEFWFTGIKIFTIIALIISGIYLIFIKQTSIDDYGNSMSNINNLWEYGGFFAGGIQGFLFSFVVVVFSFGGTELVGITAGETKNPKKVVPLAINSIIFRIILFYIATLTIIMCLYPWTKIDSNISPFVDIFNKIGISKAASLMNIVVITAALSSFNSGIYGTARMLYSVGQQNNAPHIVTRLNKHNVPYIAIMCSFIVILITVILNYLYPKQLFNILLAIASIAAMVNWIGILITHIAFKRQNKDNLTYKMPFFPISSIIVIIFFIIIVIAMYQMESLRNAVYILPAWLLLLSIAYFIKNKFSTKRGIISHE